MVRTALERARAMYAGDGFGVWDHTHIEDIASLYTPILAKIVDGEDMPFGKEGFFFADHCKQSWLDIAKEIGRVSHEQGRLATEPESVGLKELGSMVISILLIELGLCSRGDRSRELGWKPVKDNSKWIETVTEESLRVVSVRNEVLQVS
ncbi:hypothetical protein LB504_011780 [Fusarium proliferatum]|nr:hypothetical protein LB504_011780 [Fusarium proliferatum]